LTHVATPASLGTPPFWLQFEIIVWIAGTSIIDWKVPHMCFGKLFICYGWLFSFLLCRTCCCCCCYLLSVQSEHRHRWRACAEQEFYDPSTGDNTFKIAIL